MTVEEYLQISNRKLTEFAKACNVATPTMLGYKRRKNEPSISIFKAMERESNNLITWEDVIPLKEARNK